MSHLLTCNVCYAFKRHLVTLSLCETEQATVNMLNDYEDMERR